MMKLTVYNAFKGVKAVVHTGFELLHVEPGFISIRGGTKCFDQQDVQRPSGATVYNDLKFVLEEPEGTVLRWGPITTMGPSSSTPENEAQLKAMVAVDPPIRGPHE